MSSDAYLLTARHLCRGALCSCALGYHSVSASNGETCVEVNECDEWREAPACSPGTCIDIVNGFPCTSDYLTVDHDADKERCEREECGIVPVSQYATHNTTSKISFEGVLMCTSLVRVSSPTRKR